MKEMLAQSALTKVLLLLLLVVLAAIPLGMIDGLIDERGGSRQHAARELAVRHAGPQAVSGPVLVIPYTERWTEEQRDENGKLKARVERSAQRNHLLFPERSELRGRLAAQERYLGIFTVLFYDLQGGFRGRFPAFDPANLPHSEKGSTFEVHAPLVAFTVSDLRGLQGAPTLRVAGAAGRWQPRVPGLPAESWLAQGIHAPLPEEALALFRQKAALDFQLDLVLVGRNAWPSCRSPTRRGRTSRPSGRIRASADSSWPRGAPWATPASRRSGRCRRW